MSLSTKIQRNYSPKKHLKGIHLEQNRNNSFEEQLNELESIVKSMSNTQLDLEKALKMFEKGSSLSKNCQDLLSKAEQKVKLIRG